MVNATGQIGLPPIQVSPLGYTGSPLNFVPITSAGRDPTTLDIGYPTGCEWTNTVTLDVWKLLGFISGAADWVKMAAGSIPGGTVISLSDTVGGGTKVFPDGTGNISLTGTAGQITVTANPGTNNLNFSLSSGTLVHGLTPQAHTAPGTDPVVANGSGLIAVSGAAVAAATIPVRSDSLAANTLTIEVQRTSTSAATNATQQGLASFNSAQFTADASGWVNLIGGTGPALLTMSDDVNALVSPSGTGNIQLVGHVVEAGATKFSTIVAGTNLLNINPMSPARWIVDPLGFNGTHTTIVAAMAAATSGDTIFIMPGTYSGALTLKAGVNLAAFACDSYTPNVIVSGNVTASYNGTVSCSGINFKAAAGVSIACSGASSSLLELVDCTVSAVNGTGITVNDATFVVALEHCIWGATAGNACFDITSGFITSRRSTINGADGTANTIAGSFNAYQSDFSISMTTSGTGTINAFQCAFNNAANTTPITTAGTGISITSNCYFNAGTATALTIGAGTTLFVMNATVTSSNANAIAGAGTMKYGYIVFGGTSSTIAGTVTATALTVI